MFQTYLDDVKRWAKQPYNENGDVVDWILFFGLVVAATFLWTRVIRRILD